MSRLLVSGLTIVLAFGAYGILTKLGFKDTEPWRIFA